MRKIELNGIIAEYRIENDEYIITSINCENGLPETVHMDSFFEAIDEDIAQDAGEHEAERLADRYFV